MNVLDFAIAGSVLGIGWLGFDLVMAIIMHCYSSYFTLFSSGFCLRHCLTLQYSHFSYRHFVRSFPHLAQIASLEHPSSFRPIDSPSLSFWFQFLEQYFEFQPSHNL